MFVILILQIICRTRDLVEEAGKTVGNHNETCPVRPPSKEEVIKQNTGPIAV